MNDRYVKSQALLERAINVTPLGSQTFSKSYLQYPKNAAPLFLSKGKGGRVWDVDGNEYVDLVCGLLPIVLGYQDPDVDAAIQQQLKCGITFSQSTELEVQLAERLVDIIPCAEMLRFGKNGSDATSAAVRVARAFTRRDHIAVCGYHGWHDWYISSTVRNAGIPECVEQLTHRFEFNNLEALEQLLQSAPHQFAAVIMEPMNSVEPSEGYLQAVRELAHKHGALFILDEIITGFRYDLAGAQNYFGVTPDLATFGKGMGNGMPISALMGRTDVMSQLEEAFVSGTFGGECLSMAAAMAVIDKMQSQPVIQRLWKNGASLVSQVNDMINRFQLQESFSFSGKAPWMILSIQSLNDQPREVVKTIFMQEMLRHGILMQSSHNLCFAHDEQDIANVVAAYEKTLSYIADLAKTDNWHEALLSPALQPVFSVRS